MNDKLARLYTLILVTALKYEFVFLTSQVAMHREKFPEKIPFRLTHMLVNAMGVSGTEGNFRATCENVINVLREDRESLMAILEAFVYDPLFSWRLLTPNKKEEQKKRQRNRYGRGTRFSQCGY